MGGRRRAVAALAGAALVVAAVSIATGSSAATGRKPDGARAACDRALVRLFSRTPLLLHSSPPPAFVSTLGALRRARSSRDRLPRLPARGLPAVLIDFVRLLGTAPEGVRYFLAPVRSVPIPGSCLQRLPASKRHALEAERRRLRSGAVVLVGVRGLDARLSQAFSPRELDAGTALLLVRPVPEGGRLMAGLVPDGVRAVTVVPGGGAPETVAVSENLFVAELPIAPHVSLTIEWRGADGAVLKRIALDRVIDSGEALTSGPVELSIEAPPAIAQAGGEQLALFRAGRAVAAQSGCLACHRIGADGNRGPGQDLTHVGSARSETSIEHAIVDPSAPMPSFKNLPRTKLHALVVFLSLLR